MSDTYSAEDKLEKGFAPDEVVVAAAAAPDDSYIVNRYARYGRFGPLMQRLFASGVEARGVEHGARQDVRPDLGPLLEHDDRALGR